MNKIMRNAAVLVALLDASHVQAQSAPAALDLVCSTKTGVPLRFRMDLAQKKWCWEACQSVWFIDGVDDGAIRLSIHSADRYHDWNMIIDRYTGKLSAVHVGWGNDPSDGGQCMVQPFSGFPNREF